MEPTPLKILVVDDTPEDRELVRRYLNRSKVDRYELQEADTGGRGLEIFREFQPDCVLLDFGEAREFIAIPAFPWARQSRGAQWYSQFRPPAGSHRAWPPLRLGRAWPAKRSPRRGHGPAISAWIAAMR